MILFKNIAIGVFHPGQSLFHRLQARTKLLVLLWLMISLVIANHRIWHFVPYIAAVLLVVGATALSKVSARYMWGRMWLLVVIAILGAIPAVIYPGSSSEQVLYTAKPFPLSYTLIALVAGGYLLLLVAYMLLRVPMELRARLQFQRIFRGAYDDERLRRWRRLLVWVLSILAILLFTIFTYPGDTPAAGVFLVGPLIITYDALWSLLSFFLVFLLLYACSILLTMTTSPVALMEGMTMLLTPLRWLKLPVDDFALMTLIALRFIPTLFEEMEHLMKAQTARGADYSAGSMRERIQNLAALFVPFLRTTLRRAAELATALEARGYEVHDRQTMLHETGFKVADFVVMGVAVIVMVGALIL